MTREADTARGARKARVTACCGAAALGLLAALSPAIAFAAADGDVAHGRFFDGTAGWIVWFAVLFGLGVWLACAQNAGARRHPQRDDNAPLRAWTFLGAVAGAWSLSGFEVLGPFSTSATGVTLAHGILVLALVSAQLVQPLVAVSTIRGADDRSWDILSRIGQITIVLAAAGILIATFWNPTFWFTLTERIWLVAALGSLVWWIVWSAIIEAIKARRTPTDSSAATSGELSQSP